jgi:hypothetical protein
MAQSPRTLRPANNAFTPRSITGLALWLDASNAASVTRNSGYVSQWNDLSVNARHAKQDTAVNQPAYNTNPLNGRATIKFTTSNWLSGSYYAVTDHSVFIVCRFGSGSNSLARLFTVATAGDDASAPSFIPLIRGLSSLEAIESFIAGTFIARRSITYDTWFMASSIYSGTSVSNRVNGGPAATGTGSISGNAFTRYAIGTGGTSPGILGDVAECIAFSRAITDAERGIVQTYLSRKWGVSLA